MLTLFGLKTLLASQPKTSPGKKPSVTFDLLIEKANVIRKEENDVKQRNANHSGNKDVPQSLPSPSPSLSYSINHSHSARSEILRLGSDTGILCSKFLRYAPMDGDQVSSRSRFWKTDSPEKDEISFAMGNIILTLIMISQLCKLDLCVCIQKKILLNAKKYPAELCRDRHGKYTEYSDETGITKTSGQSTMDESYTLNEEMSHKRSIRDITVDLRRFASERNWDQYHLPRNIVLALMGEVGELAELFQWRGDEMKKSEEDNEDETPTELTDEDRDKIGQELADVCIYLIRLADICNIDLGKAALNI